MTQTKNGEPEASKLIWSLKLSILSYLGVRKRNPEEPFTDAHKELAELYIDVGNMLRALTPLLEKDNEPPPIGRSDTMRDLWPYYRERGLFIIDVHRRELPPDEAKHAELKQALCAILTKLGITLCLVLLACGCTTVTLETPAGVKLHRTSVLQKLEIGRAFIDTNGNPVLERYRNDGGGKAAADIAGRVTREAIEAAK